MDFAIEVFVRGHSSGKSRTFPYEASRVGPLWVMRDAARKNPRDYRKEEWIAHDVDANKVDTVARSTARGRFFVVRDGRGGTPDEATRSATRCLGYRLLATEGFFVQRLGDSQSRRFHTDRTRANTRAGGAAGQGHANTAHLATNLLGTTRRSVSMWRWTGKEIVGRVRSVDAVGATWCADMYVNPSHRRRGIGQALFGRMLRDDRSRGSKCSVLTASHTGALLYPRVGYERIGTLFMFAPRRAKS